MLYRRQKTNTTLFSPRFSAHLSWSKVRTVIWVSQFHQLSKKTSLSYNKKNKYFLEMGIWSSSQESVYRKSLGTPYFLIWFYRCWADQNTIKTKNVRGALWLRMPKGLQCYFTSLCNVSFSSFLMNECPNIELDELLFVVFIMCCIWNFSFYFSL